MTDADKRWIASHLAWDHEADLKMQKLNASRGFSCEGTSLQDDDAPGVPLEMRSLLPLLASHEPDVIENPAATFLAKCDLDRLLGHEPTLKKTPEPDLEDFLDKVLSGASEFLSTRTILPTRTMLSDTGDLQKAAHMDRATAERNRLQQIVHWIGSMLLRGETIEGLAKYARDGGDPQRADEILEIGRTFARQLAAA